MHNQINLSGNAILHWGTSNKKVVISSHGAIDYSSPAIPTLSTDLYFAAQGNRSTHGKVSSVRVMGKKDLILESAGTSGIDEHLLSWYQYDMDQEIEDCLANGFDVVTIKPHFQAKLSKILSQLGTYSAVYGLFCRVAEGQRRVKVLFSV